MWNFLRRFVRTSWLYKQLWACFSQARLTLTGFSGFEVMFCCREIRKSHDSSRCDLARDKQTRHHQFLQVKFHFLCVWKILECRKKKKKLVLLLHLHICFLMLRMFARLYNMSVCFIIIFFKKIRKERKIKLKNLSACATEIFHFPHFHIYVMYKRRFSLCHNLKRYKLYVYSYFFWCNKFLCASSSPPRDKRKKTRERGNYDERRKLCYRNIKCC